MTTHTHEPSEPVVAFFHTCKHCGVEIEPEHCKACDGTGKTFAGPLGTQLCWHCKGSGIAEWREVKQ